ncbi:MAG: GGDEF domain-containing phosphodiesterase [Angelakisella sp.]
MLFINTLATTTLATRCDWRTFPHPWLGAAILVLLLLLLASVAVLVSVLRHSRQKQLAIQQSSDFLLQVAYEDDITGLPTLTKLILDITPLLCSAQPGEYALTVVDIDNFKYINDIFGYKTGNRVLRTFAKYLSFVRSDSTRLSRTNADNFIIFSRAGLVDNLFLAVDGYHAHPMFTELEAMVSTDFQISFSVGSYVISDPTREIPVMIDYAVSAKKNGKGIYGNTFFRYSEAMDLDRQLKTKITLSMERALASNEFVPYLQPQYSLPTGKMVGAEILARWQSSNMGMVFPSEFIPLFERNGFIRKLDLFIFERSCMLLRSWLDSNAPHIPQLSVNASKLTVTSEHFVNELVEITRKYDIDHHRLQIELTESVLGEQPEAVLLVMAELKQLGFAVSVDDFGKGYSSLNLLKDIPADELKIDRGFLSDTMHSSKGREIVSSVIEMSKKLRLKTVAEGIETQLQADNLRTMGCDIAQGFYFARPMPAEEFLELLYLPDIVET